VVTWAVLVAFLAQSPAQRASALVDAGVELSNRGRFNEAGDKFVQALAVDPNFAEAHYLLGLVRQQDGRLDAALLSFRAALKINPRYKEAQARVCELDTAAARTKDTGYEGALASCHRAVQLTPGDPEPHFHIGWNLAQLGDQAGAIREYQAALQLDPKFPQVRYELARIYADTNDTASAIPLLKEVAAAEPNNRNARFLLGAALAKQGDCEAALPWLQTGTENAQKYYLMSACFRKMNRMEESASALMKVKEFRQGADARMQAKYLAALAHQKAQAGELDEAITAYRAALDLVSDATIRIDLAVALLKKGEPQEVLRLLDGETGPLARYQVALALAKLGRMAEACATLELVLRDTPRFVEAWYHLGIASIALGRNGDAERALRTAVQLRPDEAAMRLAWAEALEKLGKLEEAARQRQIGARLPTK
jgi:tetratricopeptide (TPR) repeat protein